MTWRMSDEALAALNEAIATACGDLVTGSVIAHGELTLAVEGSAVIQVLSSPAR